MNVFDLYKQGKIEETIKGNRNEKIHDEIRKEAPFLLKEILNKKTYQLSPEVLEKMIIAKDLMNRRGMNGIYLQKYNLMNDMLDSFTSKGMKRLEEIQDLLKVDIREDLNKIEFKFEEKIIGDIPFISYYQIFQKILKIEDDSNLDVFMLFLPFFNSKSSYRFYVFCFLNQKNESEFKDLISTIFKNGKKTEKEIVEDFFIEISKRKKE